MSDFFDGYYFKHQKDNHTLCLIIGKSNSEKFIQVISDNFSEKAPWTDDNKFSKKGILLNIHTSKLSLDGEIRYKNLTPIRYDIMGPFKYFPMECSHGVISMRHQLEGKVVFNGAVIDFTGGVGYIEKDSGCSFPSSYTWVQANDFTVPCAIMAAVAKIPFCGLHFKGCICVIQYQGIEYRLATYLGVKVLTCTKEEIILKQGRYRLEIKVSSQNGQALSAPKNGEMTRTIIESASCPAEFRFYIKKKLVFHLKSEHAGFEYEES